MSHCHSFQHWVADRGANSRLKGKLAGKVRLTLTFSLAILFSTLPAIHSSSDAALISYGEVVRLSQDVTGWEEPGRIVWPQVRQIYTSQTEKFSRYTLILYFSPIKFKYWRNCRKIYQTVSDRPKIIEKFSQPADENGHVLLPGRRAQSATPSL